MKTRILNFKTVETREKSIVKNNNADIVGYLVAQPEPSHKNLDIQYFKLLIESPFETKTGEVKTNTIPVLITEQDLNEANFIVGGIYLIRGRWSSVKYEDNTFGEFLYSKKVIDLNEEEVQFRNHIEVDGYIRRRPLIKECYNKYKGKMETQIETLITIPRPAGKTDNGENKIKTDTVSVAFRGNFAKASLGIRAGQRLALKGYLEECVNPEGEVIKYVIVPTDVTVLIEVEENPSTPADLEN